MADPSPPAIACSLTAEALANRRKDLLSGLLAEATEVTDPPNGLRLSFQSRPGLLEAIAQAIERERDCCQFLNFMVTCEADRGPIVVEITGPLGTRDFLRDMIGSSPNRS